ncbi:MAG TPA: zf-HC2 domain-containing protein, partial [Ktedonobacterales bacterium]
MDNDTIHMTCERAEDELSGYLDDVLDPQLRQSVEAHLATCERCQEILADFRRGDELVRALPFIEPPPDMRERFFNSSRYLHLARARSRQRNYVTPLSGALVAAAVLVLTLGGALLFRQGFLPTQQANHHGSTTTIGNPGGGIVPLPAGTRLIYEHGDALWSAPESGSGLPQQLTPKGVQVAGWSVSPSGRMVIYIDAHTGALHSIRADALNDTVVGTVTNGKAPVAG